MLMLSLVTLPEKTIKPPPMPEMIQSLNINWVVHCLSRLCGGEGLDLDGHLIYAGYRKSLADQYM